METKPLTSALNWLRDSGIHLPNGGYRSIYDRRTNRYICWGGGTTCLLSTAGAVLAWLEVGEPEMASAPLSHLVHLVCQGDKVNGVPSGEGSSVVYPSYMTFCALALVEAYEHLGEEQYLELGLQTARQVITNMQGVDGRIVAVRYLSPSWRHQIREHLLHYYNLWDAVHVPIWRRLGKVHNGDLFNEAADRLQAWLLTSQHEDGSFPTLQRSHAGRLYYGVRYRSWEELRGKHPSRHATANVQALLALLTDGLHEEACRTHHWLRSHLGPKGLFYQYEYSDGSHSYEEDTMPTAAYGHLCKLWTWKVVGRLLKPSAKG